MDGATSIARTHADRELVVSRVFDAPRELVFRMWTEQEHAARWWGPQGFTIVSCRMDVRPGGEFRIAGRAPDGTLHCKRGMYREVVAPRRLVFSFGWEDANGRVVHEMLVTVAFTEHGRRTNLMLHQTNFESITARDAHKVGWTSCLERFADYLANL